MNTKGHLHPLTIVQRRIVDIFSRIGYTVAHGPEIEDGRHNFDDLNIPHDHPARDMWDTFWLKPNKLGELLRTHTSPVQVRYMKTHTPPFAIISPGKVFRCEATDATHEAQFFQVEGLAVGKDLSVAHLKGVLEYFFSELFGKPMEVRFRPSFFPFVEPGLEVDMREVGGIKWIEVAGAGMVHPYVLSACGIDPQEYQGFAFGCGIDRLTNFFTEVPDIRMFYKPDLRFIEQF